MNSPLFDPANQVAGDAIETDHVFSPEIRIWAEFGGGDPSQYRPKEVTVNVPVCEGDKIGDYLLIIQTTLREVGKLGAIARHETALTSGPGRNVIVKSFSGDQP